MALSDRQAYGLIASASAAAFGFLVWLIYFAAPAGSQPAWAGLLPHLNACLNASTTTLMLFGIAAIKRREKQVHQRFMLSALTCSLLFLLSYISYHHLHGDTKYLGQGPLRPVYFSLLITHILASALVLPLLITTVFFALTGRFDKHPKLARITFPIWLYVSVTGVLVYLFLRPYY